ncbi:hypothetical protein NKOR_01680 [Candidatus Nitrosopumilus koreensis AR1]|uniref:Uncharacterized protein n=1 Tax=Candidatus Nitrosopumilus koreensis AR1 TaxID=1229908 RepID=K0B562_9ARCH|nr:hypothetical protein NKOR_01680 [Candidatus Nitrosopumilus koreensis AR1]
MAEARAARTAFLTDASQTVACVIATDNFNILKFEIVVYHLWTVLDVTEREKFATSLECGKNASPARKRR